MAEIILNDENFEEEVLKSDVPVLVDFWATWCGPCQVMGPIIKSVADECADKVKVCKLDIDQNMTLAQQYRVMSIPTLKLFKNGEVAKTSVGAISKDDVLAFIND